MADSGVNRLGSRGMVGGSVLLLVIGLVNLVGLGRGLAHNLSMGRGVGAEHSGANRGGVSLLDRLVADLVGSSHGKEGEGGEEEL